jgi:hypothetical protein
VVEGLGVVIFEEGGWAKIPGETAGVEVTAAGVEELDGSCWAAGVVAAGSG